MYPKESCMLVTQVACMATGHKERGISISETIAMIIHRRFPKKKFNNIFSKTTRELEKEDEMVAGGFIVETPEEKLQKVIDAYDNIKLLILDEASNVDNKSISMLLACFPNLQQLILVFDNDQIAPIRPGQFAFDMQKFFKKQQLPMGLLAKNLRVNLDPRAQQLLINDRLLMAGKAKEMVFQSLPQPGTFFLGYVLEPLFFQSYFPPPPIFFFSTLKFLS